MSRKPAACLALAAALLLTAAAAPTAFADTESLSMRVQYGDLDLTRQAGIDRLVSRLNWAAEMVCPSIAIGRFRLSDQARDCRREAIRKAVADIGSAELAARLDPVRSYPLASR
jgi:UrcA family protein